jgi:hypothetical protein
VIEQYESNVFLANTDRRFDFITVLSPSVGVDAKAGDNRLSVDYELGQYLYGIWHSQNHLDQRVRAAGEVQLTHYKFSLYDEFVIFTDRAANEDSLLLEETHNNLKMGVSAQFNRFGFDVGYINKIRAYDSKDLMLGQLTFEQRSYMDQSAYLTASYRVRSKTYVILENDLGYINYYETSEFPDSFYIDSLIGLRGEWTSKTVFNLRLGFRYQHYDKSEVVSHKPYIGPIIRGGFEYNLTKDDKFLFTLERGDYESIYGTNNYYTQNLAGVDYKHRFGNKWSCGAFGIYQLHLYPSQTTENGITAKRYDNMLTLGASIRYDLSEWISFELKYEFRDRFCRFDIFNYVDNIVMLRGTVGF